MAPQLFHRIPSIAAPSRAVLSLAMIALFAWAPASFAANDLPAYLQRGPNEISVDGTFGGETYECDNEMADLQAIIGDAWGALPPELVDELEQSLARRYPCDGGGWGFLDDIGDVLEDIGGFVEDVGVCIGSLLVDLTDEISYESLVDAIVYENLDVCTPWWKSKERQDCSVREERAQDPAWDCVRASEIEGSCISIAEISERFRSTEHNCLELDVDARLCAGRDPLELAYAPMLETYGAVEDTTVATEPELPAFGMTVYLTTSGVTLDCNGRTLTGMSGQSAIRTPYERSVSDIAIRDCDIRDTGRYGIDLKRFFRGDGFDGPMRGHERISIEGTDITDSRMLGIYVGMNSRDVSVRDFSIDGASVAAIYLEAGSTHSLISEGVISNTREKDKFGADPGAAISVDSSQHNTIEYVTFTNNPGGDIKMYKNCGENFGQICPVRRAFGASYNTVRHNEFSHDVSVASRQYRLHVLDWCEGIPVAGYWADESEGNVIHGNRFVGSMLDVNDGPNDVCGNDFVGGELELGKRVPGDFVGVLASHGGIVAENAFDASSTLDLEIALRTDDLDVRGNRDLAERCLQMSEICSGGDSSDPTERLRYESCLDLRNTCGTLMTTREVAAAQACALPLPPTTYTGPDPADRELDTGTSSGSEGTSSDPTTTTSGTLTAVTEPAPTTVVSTSVLTTYTAPEPEPAPSTSWFGTFTIYSFSLW